MKKTLTLAALAAALTLPLALNAADESKKKGGPFAAADTDKDGQLSQTEYVAAMKGKLDDAAAKARFAALDKDKNSFLSRQEFNAGAGEKKGEGKGGGKKKDAN